MQVCLKEDGGQPDVKATAKTLCVLLRNIWGADNGQQTGKKNTPSGHQKKISASVRITESSHYY